MALILGVDPGTRIVGWSVIRTEGRRMALVECGALDVRRAGSFAVRLKAIYEGLAACIDRLTPDEAVFEKVFAGKNPSSALRIGEGRGVAMACAAMHGLEVHEFSPAEVKKAVSGRGNASKAQVQEMVRLLLGLSTVPEPEDASDACAVAICRANRILYGG